MGRGIALQFKRGVPRELQGLRARPAGGEKSQPGRMFVFETGQLTHPRLHHQLPDQAALARQVADRGHRGGSRGAGGRGPRPRDPLDRDSAARAPGSAGLTGPRCDRASSGRLRDLPDVRVVVFEPQPAAAPARLGRARKVPAMTPGRAALVGLMDRYLARLLDPFVSLLEVHKLMYFMQEAGEPLRLRYVAGPYGPYAENLRHVLQASRGLLRVGLRRRRRRARQGPGAGARRGERCRTPHSKRTPSRRRGSRRSRTSSKGSSRRSVWSCSRPSTGSSRASTRLGEEDLIARTYAWAERKRQFSPQQIRLARRVLAAKGWIAGPAV